MRRREFVATTILGAASFAAFGERLALAAAEEGVAKLATVAPDGTPWADQLIAFKTRLDKETGGKMRLKAYLGGALGDENTTASECKRGAIQMWGGSTGALATIVPELALLELPYLFRTVEEADHVLDTILFEDMKKLLLARGLVLLFWAENGYRSFGTKFGGVTKPTDLKGKKMRSQESEVHLEMYKAFGASPVPIAVTEVLSSLQTGVVDGFDNTPLFTFAASWHQGIKHYSLTESIYQPGIVVANKKWFDALPAEVKKSVVGDAQAEAVNGRKGVRELAPLLVENFKNAGITVHVPTEAEKAVFAKVSEPVHTKWTASKGKTAAPMVAKAKAALAAYRKKA